MTIASNEKQEALLSHAGEQMHALAVELYPICRSISGEGVRQTLNILQRLIPLAIHEVPTGTSAYDWTVPVEWNIRDAYIKDSSGNRVVDFQKSNLHVMSYSMPVHGSFTLDELKPHLITMPQHPDWIPYRTSYYQDSWGFCLSHRQYMEMKEGVYEVCIDAAKTEGSLTYGELLVPGKDREEILISCHICHPSLCNDNLSGISIATYLALLRSLNPGRYSIRFLFIPGTIGSIVWLSRNESLVKRIAAGWVLAGMGDGGSITYKRSRRGGALVDRAFAHMLKHSGAPYSLRDFSPYGYDERQFCSPGFNLPIGCLMRTPFNEYPEYHTSADNPDFVFPEALADSLDKCRNVLSILDRNKIYRNLNPKCEPQLGKRGLYRPIGAQSLSKSEEMAMLWMLNMSDGKHDLLDIADRSEIEFSLIHTAADRLFDAGLLEELTVPVS